MLKLRNWSKVVKDRKVLNDVVQKNKNPSKVVVEEEEEKEEENEEKEYEEKRRRREGGEGERG
jgi:hypothetical protein